MITCTVVIGVMIHVIIKQQMHVTMIMVGIILLLQTVMVTKTVLMIYQMVIVSMVHRDVIRMDVPMVQVKQDQRVTGLGVKAVAQ